MPAFKIRERELYLSTLKIRIAFANSKTYDGINRLNIGSVEEVNKLFVTYLQYGNTAKLSLNYI